MVVCGGWFLVCIICVVRWGSACSILFFQSSVRLAGQIIRAGYWLVCSVVAIAWRLFPSPISSAMKHRCFSVA